MHLLDTDILSLLQRGNSRVIESIEALESSELATTLVTKIEGLRKIGRADLLIASIALANDATLVTRNVRHFEQVPGLRLVNWNV